MCTGVYKTTGKEFLTVYAYRLRGSLKVFYNPPGEAELYESNITISSDSPELF